MTKEELLEHGIYVPNKVDETIVTHLLMGNQVLCYYYETITQTWNYCCLTPVRDTLIPNRYRFSLMRDYEYKLILIEDCNWFKRVEVNGLWTNHAIGVDDIKNILNWFEND